jgi:ribosomal protein L40E
VSKLGGFFIMAKIPEATARLFSNIFVCKKCKTKQRAAVQKIMQKKVSCRKCGGKAFRAIKKGK